jgi:uncharacterized protein YuzE
MDNKKISISYDREADVMYMSFQDVEAEAEELDEGIFARYNPNDQSLVGFTIINFSMKFAQAPKDIQIPLKVPA